MSSLWRKLTLPGPSSTLPPMAFKCVVVTPEQQLLDESLTQAIIPAYDGLLGILTDRAPPAGKARQRPAAAGFGIGTAANLRNHRRDCPDEGQSPDHPHPRGDGEGMTR